MIPVQSRSNISSQIFLHTIKTPLIRHIWLALMVDVKRIKIDRYFNTKLNKNSEILHRQITEAFMLIGNKSMKATEHVKRTCNSFKIKKEQTRLVRSMCKTARGKASAYFLKIAQSSSSQIAAVPLRNGSRELEIIKRKRPFRNVKNSRLDFILSHLKIIATNP